MSRPRFAVALMVAGLVSPIAGAEIPLAVAERVVVLRNGYVLRGRVTPLGDQYLVSLGDDNEVRLPAGRVAMVCADLEEAYLRQRDLFVPTDVRSHVKLADWCLRHHLTARAADQILAVFALDPAHPELAMLDRRLRNRERRAAGTTAPSQHAPEAQAGAEPSLSALPSEALQRFTAIVQPLLMNRCATNACHGRQSVSEGTQGPQFRLLRPAFGQILTQRITQHNLHAVLAQVDFRYPEGSPLLTMPRQPHGGAAEPVFGATDGAAWESLEGWVRMLGRARADAPEIVTSPQTSRGQARSLTHRSSSAEAGDTPPTEPGENPLGPRVGQPAAAQPEDPFDPEIFHRRHAGEMRPEIRQEAGVLESVSPRPRLGGEGRG
jgi:hypothetical protein